MDLLVREDRVQHVQRTRSTNRDRADEMDPKGRRTYMSPKMIPRQCSVDEKNMLREATGVACVAVAGRFGPREVSR